MPTSQPKPPLWGARNQRARHSVQADSQPPAVLIARCWRTAAPAVAATHTNAKENKWNVTDSSTTTGTSGNDQDNDDNEDDNGTAMMFTNLLCPALARLLELFQLGFRDPLEVCGLDRRRHVLVIHTGHQLTCRCTRIQNRPKIADRQHSFEAKKHY